MPLNILNTNVLKIFQLHPLSCLLWIFPFFKYLNISCLWIFQGQPLSYLLWIFPPTLFLAVTWRMQPPSRPIERGGEGTHSGEKSKQRGKLKTHSGEKSKQSLCQRGRHTVEKSQHRREEKEHTEEKSQNRGGRRNLQTNKYRFDCQIFGLESRQFKLWGGMMID